MLEAPGQQSPRTVVDFTVDTDTGKAGNYFNKMYQNWYPADPTFGTPIPSQADTFNPDSELALSPRTYIPSMERLARECDIVMPGHEPYIPWHVPAQWYFTSLQAEQVSSEEKSEYDTVKSGFQDQVPLLKDL